MLIWLRWCYIWCFMVFDGLILGDVGCDLGEIKILKILKNTGICLCFSRGEIFMNWGFSGWQPCFVLWWADFGKTLILKNLNVIKMLVYTIEINRMRFCWNAYFSDLCLKMPLVCFRILFFLGNLDFWKFQSLKNSCIY